MSNLTDVMETRLLDYATRGTTPPALTGPMRIQLLSALGTNDAPGTPVTGAIQPLGATAPAAPGGTNSNTAVLRFEGLPNPTTVAGYRVLDSAGTPVITIDNIPRVKDDLTPEVLVVTSGVFEVPAGGIVFTAE